MRVLALASLPIHPTNTQHCIVWSVSLLLCALLFALLALLLFDFLPKYPQITYRTQAYVDRAQRGLLLVITTYVILATWRKGFD